MLSAALPAVEPVGPLHGLPADSLAAARDSERHIIEVETGLPPGAETGVVPRPGYDPAVHTLAEQDRVKASELGVSVRTVQGRRARYAAQGLWGLVDQRATQTWEVTSRADPQLVEAALEVIATETSAAMGTRSRLMRRVMKREEEIHRPGVVPLSGRSAFYKLLERLTTGKHTFGSAVTRRQMANRPQMMFTPTSAIVIGWPSCSTMVRWGRTT